VHRRAQDDGQRRGGVRQLDHAQLQLGWLGGEERVADDLERYVVELAEHRVPAAGDRPRAGNLSPTE
jgi:hypothetical protein